MSKRKYTKKSPYWSKFNKPINEMIDPSQEGVSPVSAGESYYVSSASSSTYSRTSSTTSTGRRRNRISVASKNDKFTNIRNGLLPYEVSADGVDVRDAIELCQKAYANVPIFRNAIDIMAELANSPIYVDEGNEASRTFVEKWFSKIKKI